MDIREIREKLTAAGIENAATEALWIKETIPEQELPRAVARRAAHEPLAYIFGEWEFFREKYAVNENCLVPRADTELLVEKACAFLPKGARFLDLCTGSGCVAISTLATRRDTTAVALDLSRGALALARKNAETNGVAPRVEFVLSDVLRAPDAALVGKFDAVLANPPYIAHAVLATLQEEVQKEPRMALDGGADGLDFYRAILRKWKSVLRPDGFFLLEIGYDQARSVGRIAADAGLSCEVFADLGGNDRVVFLH